MKYIKYKIVSALFFIGGLMTMPSCSDFLKETPFDFVGKEDLDDSQATLEYLVTGVYSKWSDNLFRFNDFPYALELDADYISGPSWLLGSLGAGNFQDDGKVAGMWKGLYSLVERSNIARELIVTMDRVSEEEKNNALGELAFQKAYAYFMLTRAFGEIPLNEYSAKKAQSLGLDIYNGRSPIEDVYAEIIELLEFAEDNLYPMSHTKYKVGHIAQGSAAGLLMKVYATMASGALQEGTLTIKTGQACNPNKASELYPASPMSYNVKQVKGYESFDVQLCYNKVIEYAEMLEQGVYGDYTLIDFEDMWQHKTFNRTSDAEYMFTIYAVSNDEVYGNSISRYYSYTEAPDGAVFKGLWVGNRNHWYDLFEPTDRRITEGILHHWKLMGKDNTSYFPQSYADRVEAGIAPFDDPNEKYLAATGSSNLAFSYKYYHVTDRKAERSDAYYSLLRYADIVLLHAEALNELTPGSDKAKSLVASVRLRADSGAMVSDLEIASSRDDLRSLIIEERAKELAFEADRRWDLIRWGVYLEAMNALKGPDESGVAKSRTERNLLYPIPVDEILANKKITSNNPGWN